MQEIVKKESKQEKHLKVKQEAKLQKQYLSEVKKNRRNKKMYDFSGEINFENISYTYSRKTPFEFKALDEANLTIKKNIITAIIGTTGSGKSTLIQLTNGLIISDTGRTVVGDYPIPAKLKKIKEVKKLRREVGLVFQFPEYQLFESTVEKDIAFGPITMGLDKQESFAEVPKYLKMVDLPVSYASQSPLDLSGGQKRRVAIAGIIAMKGSTIVLDEPTGGLDPQGENDFMNLFVKLNEVEKRRIIIVTHNMDHVLRIADEVIVMSKGKIIAQGTPFEIFSREELLKSIDIDLPKLYQLAHKLKAKGIDIINEQFRTIEDLTAAIAKKMKSSKEVL